MTEHVYAHISDGYVVNISVWDGVAEYTPPEDETLVLNDVGAQIGWEFADGEFVNPYPEVE